MFYYADLSGHGARELNLQKRADLEEALAKGMTQVVLDGSHPGVDLPSHLKGNVQVRLNLSHSFRLRVFELTAEGVRASLSFSRVEHLCVLPWEAIYSMQPTRGDDPGRLYFPSLPQALKEHFLALSGLSEEELSAQLGGAPRAPLSRPTPPPPSPLRRADEALEGVDESWSDRLPHVSSPAGRAPAPEEGGEGEEEEGVISFSRFQRPAPRGPAGAERR